jgi:NDP-sugar pyrophosphorylase family protein
MLMKAILICPGERAEVPFLALNGSLAAVPALGQAVVDYWMSHLACSGFKEVLLLAGHSADEVKSVVGNGSKWGMPTSINFEALELTAEQATAKYEALAFVMDCFPGHAERPLFSSYANWFAALEAWMPHAKTPDRVGVHEINSGIWVGRQAHVSSEATLRAPCWLGDHVYVGPDAVIGPHAIVESRAFLEPGAQVENSVIGPDTFVGRYVQIKDSLVWGSSLVDWRTGMESTVSDAFLLCSLHRPPPREPRPRLVNRLSEFLKSWKDDESLANDPMLIK